METTRELNARWESLTFDRKRAELTRRRNAATAVLQGKLRPGDKFRAVTRCGGSETTCAFSHWEKGWIVTRSGLSISPAAVYSVNSIPQRF